MVSSSLTSVFSFCLVIHILGVFGSVHRHYAPAIQKRQEPAPSTYYTLFTPSPGAAPVPVTKQGQVLTTYIPQYTLCPIAVDPASTAIRGNGSLPTMRSVISTAAAPTLTAMRSNASSPTMRYVMPTAVPSTGRIIPRAMNSTGLLPIVNATASAGLRLPWDGCSTAYDALVTSVCVTTLKGIATAITITDCAQEVVFSTDLSFRVVMPTIAGVSTVLTAAPSAETVTTQYIAHWQELTGGRTPSEVIQRVCSAGGSQCFNVYESWDTTTVTKIRTTSTTIDTTYTVSGPSRLFIDHYSALITDTRTSIIVSTVKTKEVASDSVSTIEVPTSTVTRVAEATAALVDDTYTQTVPVYLASSDGGITSTSRSTTTLTSTSTKTVTLPLPSA